jgi:hypothetical protein
MSFKELPPICFVLSSFVIGPEIFNFPVCASAFKCLELLLLKSGNQSSMKSFFMAAW